MGSSQVANLLERLRLGPTITATRQSLDLLTWRSRRRLALLVAANMATSLMDLAGVVLIGAFTIMLTSFVGQASGEGVTSILGMPVPTLFDDPRTGILVVGSLALAFLVGKSAIGAYLSRRTLRFLANRQTEVSQSLLKATVAMPLVRIEERPSQETTFALTGGVSTAIVGLLGAVSLGLSEMALLAVLGVGLLAMSPGITVAAGAFFLLLALFMHFVLGSWAGRNGRLMASTGHALMQGVQETLGVYRELKVSAQMDPFVERLATRFSGSAQATATGVFISQIPKYVYETALLLGALALAAWEFSASEPEAAVATVAVFFTAGTRIMPSMLRLQNDLVAVRTSAGFGEPTYDLQRRVTHEQRAAGTTSGSVSLPSGPFSPRVELEHVTVTYPGARSPALLDISLRIAPGAFAAITGSTGAGKSSLADVILGVLPADTGSVRVGGMPPDLAASTFPGSLAYLPQSVMLVSGTILQNVALGYAPDAIDVDRVWQVLELVRLDGLLRDERSGLETEVGERGVRFSGGQRQRLGLARALYSEPALLVLDEATSALDAQTEATITTALDKLRGNTTVIFIAHRLSTVRTADVVFYLEDASLVAQGTFDDVRGSVPRFDQSARLLGL